jgi:LysM repeat protein
MSFPYTIVYGDTLTRIAQRHGLQSWKEIYYLPENAPFRAKRPNPDKIYPGDVVLIPGTDPNAPPPSPPPPSPLPPPVPAPEPLPTSFRFIIHRMASEESFAGTDRDLFFNVFDPTNGLFAIYWLAPNGRPTTQTSPNKVFHGASRRFSTKAPHAINDLTCQAMYTSREDEHGQVTSRMVLFLSSGPVQLSMPHHLIGPNGAIKPAKGPSAGVGTGIGGVFRFVKMASGFHE